MNILDIIILVPLLLFAYQGFKKGIVIEIAGLAALILGLYFALYFSDRTAVYLNQWFKIDPQYLGAVAFVVTLLLVMLVVIFIGKALEKFINILLLGFFNKLSGAVFGLLKGALIMSVLIFLINYFDTGRHIFKQETCDQSIFYHPVESIAPALYDWIQTTTFNFHLPEKQEVLDNVL